jgi:hypothetical protein
MAEKCCCQGNFVLTVRPVGPERLTHLGRKRLCTVAMRYRESARPKLNIDLREG